MISTDVFEDLLKLIDSIHINKYNKNIIKS